MSNYSKKYSLARIKDAFARLFVLGILNKANLFAFTSLLEKSEYVKEIEEKHYDKADSSKLEDLFYEISSMELREDDSFGIYNDAYWCGFIYFELHLRMHKPFSYLFLKLPLETLLNMYPIYHEMDITQVEKYLIEREKDNTIIKLLCVRRKTKLTELSRKTGISINTIKKYALNDETIYAASFQNIVKIAYFFDVPLSLFIKEL